MRDFLTGLAIILIVVLTTMLVAPYFVDWTSQRGFLEARLSHALGQKVTIGGAIDLKLLPTPYLVLDQVVVGGDDGPVRIGIHHLDLELSVAPLLHGEFDIVEAQLEEPTIRVNLEHDRTLPGLPAAPAFQADVRFDRIQVSDGTLAIADPQSGRTFVYDHLDLDADAGALTGPFKVSGAEGPAEHRTKFRLATTSAENGRAHARLVIDEAPAHAGLELDGTIYLAGAGAGSIRQSFDGTLVAAGHLSQMTDAPIAWKLAGPFKADPTQATLDGGDLRFGSEDAGVALKVNANAQLSGQPRLALDLSAAQLDLDRLAGAPVDGVKPPSPKLPDLAALRRILAEARPPIQTDIALAIDNATYDGETLSGLEAHLGLGESAQPLKVSGDGPGGSHVAIDGMFAMDSTPSFAGNVDFEADNLPRTADWLDSVASGSTWKGSDMPFKSVRVAGHLKAGATSIEGDKLAMTLDSSVLGGTARLVLGNTTQAAKLTADLDAKALDLDGLPSLDRVRGSSVPLDLDLHLDAKAIKVSRVGDGALDTGHLRLAFAKSGSHIAVTDFHADDLGGATIQANGSLDPKQGKLAMTLDAAHLDAATSLLRQLAPGPLAEALVARSSTLAPASLTIDATLTPDVTGVLAPAQWSIAGMLGATRIDAIAKPDAGATSISATLEAPDGSDLLAQFGVPSLPVDVVGPGSVKVSARGRPGEKLDSTLAATLGATELDVAGRFDILSVAPGGSGTLRLRSPDLTPLLQSVALAFPDMTGRIPADVGGTLTLDKGGVTLDDLKGRIAGIGTSGTLHYRRSTGDEPAVTGTMAFDHLALSGLLGLALGPPQVAAPDASWSKAPLAVGLIDPPASALRLSAKTLEIVPGVEATNASLDLGVAQNLVTLKKLAAEVSGGRLDADATLRRDGRQATVEGRLALDRVRVRAAALDATLTGSLDLAGGGSTSLGLMASLAGSGDATAADVRIPGADPSALPKIFQDVETDALAVDQDVVTRAFEEASKAPLAAGTRHFAVSLAAGVLHFEPKDADRVDDGIVSTKVDTSFDLTRLHLDAHVAETLAALPKTWTGAPPTVVVTLTGPLAHPTRSVDVSSFLNAVAARALARESARIEAYEFDIRERALFNARLQSERRREADRQQAEDDARKAAAQAAAKADADRDARLEAVRLERARKEQASEAARAKARERGTSAPSAIRRLPQPSVGSRPTPRDRPPNAPDASQPATDPSTLGRY